MSTVDQEEVENFSKLAARWWDPHGPFRPLHKFNPVRLDFIRAEVCRHFDRSDLAAPFAGLKLLDVGCGGGLLAEPMARLGASVTAIDASEKNIGTAKAHAAENGLAIDYRCTPIETLDPALGNFDVILNMEVIEHVADARLFLESCYGRLNPGGIMILATLNRTITSYALAIVGAEYVLGWLPRGTHDWNRFLKPEEVAGLLSNTPAHIRGPYGVSYHPLCDRWDLSADTAVNYLLVVERLD